MLAAADVPDWLTILIKAVAGGGLVIAFALLSETLDPKRFAGLFGAAPAVALTGLTVTLATKGAHDADQAAIGMLAGAAGMLLYAACTVRLVRDGRGVTGPLAGLVIWAAATALVSVSVL